MKEKNVSKEKACLCFVFLNVLCHEICLMQPSDDMGENWEIIELIYN